MTSSDRARVRVSLSTGELEVEGTEDFVQGFRSDLDAMIDRLGKGAATSVAADAAALAGKPVDPASPIDAAEFGEGLLALPREATATDQILLAGLFAQKESTDSTFGTKDANTLLLEQSVKVGNASQCIKNNLMAKRVFKVGTRYRVSRTGEEHLSSLTGGRSE